MFIEIELATKKTYENLCDNGFVYVGQEWDDDYFVNKLNPHFSRYKKWEIPFVAMDRELT